MPPVRMEVEADTPNIQAQLARIEQQQTRADVSAQLDALLLAVQRQEAEP